MLCELLMGVEDGEDSGLILTWSKQYEFPFFPRPDDAIEFDRSGPYHVTLSTYDCETKVVQVMLSDDHLLGDDKVARLQEVCANYKADGWRLWYGEVGNDYPAKEVAIAAADNGGVWQFHSDGGFYHKKGKA